MSRIIEGIITLFVAAALVAFIILGATWVETLNIKYLLYAVPFLLFAFVGAIILRKKGDM